MDEMHFQSEKTLGICVPTYNRNELLTEMLSEMLPGLSNMGIPLTVVDNCSTDNTENTVRTLMEEYSNLYYFRQPSNLGYDMNFETALKISKTEYTWVLGDSDRIYCDRIAELLELLRNTKPSIYVVNYQDRVDEISSCNYTCASQLLREIGWHLSSLSVCIYSKSVIQKANFEKYRNTNFIHFGVIFDTLANMADILVMWDSRVWLYGTQLRKTNSWNPYRIIEIFGKDWTKMILSLPDTIHYDSKLHCIKEHGKRGKLFTLRKLLRQRAVNGLNKAIYQQYKEYIPYFAPDYSKRIQFCTYWPNIFNKYYWRYKCKGKV